MAEKAKNKPVRKARADAARNRLRLLETAKSAFAEKGPAASLEEIARATGVGSERCIAIFPPGTR